MDSQPQDNILPEPGAIEEVYRAYRSTGQDNPTNRHNEERKAADNAEDALYKKIPDGQKDELRRVIQLRAEVTELDAADIFADGFRYGAKLILDILRPEKPS